MVAAGLSNWLYRASLGFGLRFVWNVRGGAQATPSLAIKRRVHCSPSGGAAGIAIALSLLSWFPLHFDKKNHGSPSK